MAKNTGGDGKRIGKPLPGSLGDEDKPLEERVGVVVAIILVVWLFAMGLIIGSIKIIEWVM